MMRCKLILLLLVVLVWGIVAEAQTNNRLPSKERAHYCVNIIHELAERGLKDLQDPSTARKLGDMMVCSFELESMFVKAQRNLESLK